MFYKSIVPAQLHVDITNEKLVTVPYRTFHEKKFYEPLSIGQQAFSLSR